MLDDPYYLTSSFLPMRHWNLQASDDIVYDIYLRDMDETLDMFGWYLNFYATHQEYLNTPDLRKRFTEFAYGIIMTIGCILIRYRNDLTMEQKQKLKSYLKDWKLLAKPSRYL